MTKSATDLMQEIVFSAVLDAIAALKSSSKGLPNTLLRELNAIHANTTFADLPKELQAAISASVGAAFTRLLKSGYSVSPAQSSQASASRPRPAQDIPPRGRREDRPPPRRDGDKGPGRGPGRGPGSGPGGSRGKGPGSGPRGPRGDRKPPAR